jgi:hypothetical protein
LVCRVVNREGTLAKETPSIHEAGGAESPEQKARNK